MRSFISASERVAVAMNARRSPSDRPRSTANELFPERTPPPISNILGRFTWFFLVRSVLPERGCAAQDHHRAPTVGTLNNFQCGLVSFAQKVGTQNRFGCAVGDDRAAAQQYTAIGVSSEREVMHHGYAADSACSLHTQ